MRELLRHRVALTHGFLGQACSSLTNFGLTLLAGRLLGPSGLGVVFLGFAGYLVALGLQRALLVEPLVSATSADAGDRHKRSANRGVTLSLVAGAIATLLTVSLAGLFSGSRAEGLLLIAPWLLPALLQDLVRNILFRDGRPSAAAANDAVWLAAMVVALPLPLAVSSTVTVAAWWGIGAVTAAVVGLVQLRVRPDRPADALRWWVSHVWPFGRWVAAATATANTLNNLTIFFLSSILGVAALGGLRSAEAVFSPLTLVIPALSLPGLPALVRARAEAPGSERRLAAGLSLVAATVAIAFLVVLALGGSKVLGWLFGDAFLPFTNLLWPIAVAQIGAAVGVGFMVLIKAQRRGPAVLLNRAVGSAVTLLAAVILASSAGVTAAAWGMAIGALVSSALVTVTALRDQGDPGARDRPSARSAAWHERSPSTRSA